MKNKPIPQKWFAKVFFMQHAVKTVIFGVRTSISGFVFDTNERFPSNKYHSWHNLCSFREFLNYKMRAARF